MENIERSIKIQFLNVYMSNLISKFLSLKKVGLLMKSVLMTKCSSKQALCASLLCFRLFLQKRKPYMQTWNTNVKILT